jgi:ribA/ribD-fused uncharacterized protein
MTIATSECIFFYGHSDSAGAFAPLSNWYTHHDATFVVDMPAHIVSGAGRSAGLLHGSSGGSSGGSGDSMRQLRFQNTEQLMMWAKAILFGDMSTAQQLLSTTGGTPKEAKRLGRAVKGFEAHEWARYARQIVEYGCMHKFNQSGRLKSLLLGTGSKVLVEASKYDAVWGIKLEAKEAERLSPRDWKGGNWLGQVLMRVRQRLAVGSTGAAVHGMKGPTGGAAGGSAAGGPAGGSAAGGAMERTSLVGDGEMVGEMVGSNLHTSSSLAPGKPRAVVIMHGSFNPVHLGHIGMMHSARKQLETAGYVVAAGIIYTTKSTHVAKKKTHQGEQVKPWTAAARVRLIDVAAMEAGHAGWLSGADGSNYVCATKIAEKARSKFENQYGGNIAVAVVVGSDVFLRFEKMQQFRPLVVVMRPQDDEGKCRKALAKSESGAFLVATIDRQAHTSASSTTVRAAMHIGDRREVELLCGEAVADAIMPGTEAEWLEVDAPTKRQKKEAFYMVGAASSSRSVCKSCGAKIEPKGVIRAARASYYQGQLNPAWYHIKCCGLVVAELRRLEGWGGLGGAQQSEAEEQLVAAAAAGGGSASTAKHRRQLAR